MPVLEAMTVGVPVIAANRGALPEVLGDAGLLIDPDQPTDLADAIARLLADQAFATECVRRGLARSAQFRWERTARQVHEAYQQALDSHGRRTRDRH
jgi:glycosyltransferase involved in cell wall biosynthesis